MFAYVQKATVWEAFITRIFSAERGREARHEKRPRDTFLVLGHYQNEGVNNTRHLACLAGTHGFFNVELLVICVLNLRNKSHSRLFAKWLHI